MTSTGMPVYRGLHASLLMRICADLRRLNSVTRPFSYPIPRVDETLEALRGSNIFCILDMNNAYFQVGVVLMTGTRLPSLPRLDVTVFPGCPSAVRGPPSIRVRLLDVVLKDVPSSSCVHYFDVVVHGTNFEEVLDRLTLF